jgi:hypothetical protein
MSRVSCTRWQTPCIASTQGGTVIGTQGGTSRLILPVPKAEPRSIFPSARLGNYYLENL